MPPSSAELRLWFEYAAGGFAELIDLIDPAKLDDPGLGEWSVRSLLGHSCRAFTTIEDYLAASRAFDPGEQLHGPVAYFHAAFASVGDPAEVAARGVAAGQALGDDPIAAAHAIADRVRPVVRATPDEAILVTPVGVMRLIDYLPTRAFELTVHALDLAAATGAEPVAALEHAVPHAVRLATALAGPGDAIALLRAATGRGPLRAGFTVLG
ncbi:maleylpyruvate isomerase N-terminal domain-containing protein [Gordonia iterans]